MELHTFVENALLGGVEGDGDGGRSTGCYGAFGGGDGYAATGVFGAGDDKWGIAFVGGGEYVCLFVAPLGEGAEVVRKVVEHKLWLGRIILLLLPPHGEGCHEKECTQ